LEIALLIENIAEVVVRVGIFRLNLNGSPHLRRRGIRLAVAPEVHAVIVVHESGLWVETKRCRIFAGRLIFVTSQFQQVTIIGVEIANVWINPQRLLDMDCGFFDFSASQKNARETEMSAVVFRREAQGGAVLLRRLVRIASFFQNGCVNNMRSRAIGNCRNNPRRAFDDRGRAAELPNAQGA
jgi:hypothetical protein